MKKKKMFEGEEEIFSPIEMFEKNNQTNQDDSQDLLKKWAVQDVTFNNETLNINNNYIVETTNSQSTPVAAVVIPTEAKITTPLNPYSNDYTKISKIFLKKPDILESVNTLKFIDTTSRNNNHRRV